MLRKSFRKIKYMNKTIEQIVSQVLAVISDYEAGSVNTIPVGVSSRHLHLSESHLEELFGYGYELKKRKELAQEGEFAAEETVTLVGPKGVISGVRVLGPVRKFTQIEISVTDGFRLGITPPVRDSGDIENSPGIVVVGTRGAINLERGVICAARHVHMNDGDARRFNVADSDRVAIKVTGPRGGTFENVLVRVSPKYRLEFHIDPDEANAVGLRDGHMVNLLQ
jgi:propanediol utilization protein